MPLSLAAATLGAGIAAAGAGIFNGIYNAYRQDEINAKNLAYNEKLTREQWSRDDSAVQRRVADLKAAGLSPVLAAGSAASNSQPIASNQTSRDVDFGNPAMAILSAMQQGANIKNTQAGTDLTKFQTETEAFKQNVMQSELEKNYAQSKLYDAQQQNMALQNLWYENDMLSKINLRSKQGQNLVANTQLLNAKTLFEQMSLNRLKVDIDNLKTMGDIYKINRDQANFDLTTSGLRLYTDTWSKNKGLFGDIFGDFRTPFSSFDIRHAINNVDSSWYWDK